MRRHAPALTLLILLAPPPTVAAQELKERATFHGHTFTGFHSTLSPDGKFLASGGGDNRKPELKLWDAPTGKEVAVLDLHADRFPVGSPPWPSAPTANGWP